MKKRHIQEDYLLMRNLNTVLYYDDIKNQILNVLFYKVTVRRKTCHLTRAHYSGLPVFDLTAESRMPSREAANTNFNILGFTQQMFEPTTSCTWVKHATARLTRQSVINGRSAQMSFG